MTRASVGVEDDTFVKRLEEGAPVAEDGTSALVRRRASWCRRGRPGVEEGALVWKRAPWCGGQRAGVEDSVPV